MDRELERFKTDIDLRAFAEAHGFRLDPKESWAGSAVMRHPNNDKIIITRDAKSGHYVYCSVRDDADNGTVIDFAMRRLGLNLGSARKALRAFTGTPAPVAAPCPPLLGVAKDRARVERVFARMKIASRHPYLENERGIPAEVLADRRFAGRIRMDERHGNAVFPHFDATGLCGYEIKNTGFTGFSTGGIKALWTSHIENGDKRLVVCESAIDALSYAALFPEQHTRYASIGGRPTPSQKELLRAAAAAMSSSTTIVAAMDADAAGRELAEIVREAVKLTGRADLRFESIEPEEVKDFNDALRRRAAFQQPKTV
jgi:hypothetical protein